MLKDLRSCVFNVSLAMVIVATIGMVTVNIGMNTASDGFYLAQSKLRFLYLIFILMFLVFYTTLVVFALTKYSLKRKMCTFTNIKIIVLSIVLLYPLSDEVGKMNERYSAMKTLVEPRSVNCADSESPMYVFSKI